MKFSANGEDTEWFSGRTYRSRGFDTMQCLKLNVSTLLSWQRGVFHIEVSEMLVCGFFLSPRNGQDG